MNIKLEIGIKKSTVFDWIYLENCDMFLEALSEKQEIHIFLFSPII